MTAPAQANGAEAATLRAIISSYNRQPQARPETFKSGARRLHQAASCGGVGCSLWRLREGGLLGDACMMAASPGHPQPEAAGLACGLHITRITRAGLLAVCRP